MWSRIIVSALAVVSGCTPPEPQEEPPSEPDRLVFKMITKERTYDDCIAGAEGCTYVRLDFPVLAAAPSGFAVEAVTEAVFSWVRAGGDEGSYPTVEALMDDFIDSYRTRKENNPDYDETWFLERKVIVLHNTPDIVSWSLVRRRNAGGEQGTEVINFLNLDPRTGERITLSDVLVEGYEDRLLPLAEARFRSAREIEEGASLAEAGFSGFENDTFSLTDNFSIGEDGLTFYYNRDEVAPYDMGATEITLSYRELGDVLKEELPWIDEIG